MEETAVKPDADLVQGRLNQQDGPRHASGVLPSQKNSAGRKPTMKSALLLLTLFTSIALAETGNRVSLQLGTVTVWLGMDKAMAKQQIEAAGMDFDSGHSVVTDLQAKRVYTLRFENNKLVYADRNWLHDESNALPSVMDALTSLIDQGATKCTIEHAPMSDPDTKVNRVFIDCGMRGILLTSGSVNLAGQPYTDNSVYEIIGRLIRSTGVGRPD